MNCLYNRNFVNMVILGFKQKNWLKFKNVKNLAFDIIRKNLNSYVENTFKLLRLITKPRSELGLTQEEDDLEKWIKRELTVDIRNELNKHRENVKKLLRLMPSGEIIIKTDVVPISSKEQIALYMIGKFYSNYVKYAKERTATNKELVDTLALPEGTVKNSLFQLRKEGSIVSLGVGVHQIKMDRIGVILKEILSKEK